MNTTSKTLLATVVIAFAGAASLVLGDAPEAAAPGQQIVKLERVVIEGRRTPDVRSAAAKIERLPTVVIEGRRAGADTELAAVKACPVTAVC